MAFKFDLQRHTDPSPKNLLLGAGPLYFDRFDSNGNSTGLRPLGNVEKFPFRTEVQKVTKKSSMSAARRTYAEAVQEISASATATLDEFIPANLALAMYGEEGIIRQTAQTVTDELHKVQLGNAIQLPYYKINNVVIKRIAGTDPVVGAASPFTVVTSTGTVTSGGNYSGTTAGTYYVIITDPNTTPGDIAGCKFKYRKELDGVYSAEMEAAGDAQELAEGVTVTLAVGSGQSFVANDIYQIPVTPANGSYISGTDYRCTSVEARSGLIFIPETSSIPDGTEVEISYSVPEATIPKVSGATVGSVEGRLLFLGDPSYGPCYNGDFWHVSLTPNGDIGLIGDDFATFDINITCLDDSANHPEEPFCRLVKLS